MTINAQAFPPKVLGFWTRTLRLASNLSQDALAEGSGLTVRTIQRVEAGEQTSRTTRRCIARGFGYNGSDIFDDPNFVNTITSLMDTLKADAIKAEEARYPDHIKLAVSSANNGAGLCSLIDRSEAWVFHCNEQAGPEGEANAAILFDHLQDYSDIWAELPPSGRLKAQGVFAALLADLARHGLQAFHGLRALRLVALNNQAPLPFTIAYVTVAPVQQDLSYILVPKAG